MTSEARSGADFSLWLAPLILVASAGVLFGIDRSLARDEATARDMRDRIGRLIRKDERDKIPLAAITIEIGEHEKYTYAKLEDRWRLLDARNAVADAEALERLWKALLDGEGVVHSTDPNRLAEYGFSNASVIRVILHGPEVRTKKDRDVRYRCELGNRIPDLDGCYVRRDGSSHVWAIDSDPRAIIEGSRTGSLPPLLETSLVSRAWQFASSQLDSVTIEAEGSAPLVLRMEQLQIDPEEMRAGKDPFKWTATSGGAEVPVDSRTAMSYYSFLVSAKGSTILDPAAAPARGIDTKAGRSAGRVTFQGKAGTPCVLLVGKPESNRNRAVYNAESSVLFDTSPDVADYFFATPEELASTSAENPWQQYMARQQQATAPSIETPPIK